MVQSCDLGKNAKVEDYSRLQEPSSAKSTGNTSLQFLICYLNNPNHLSADNGLTAPDSATTALGSTSNFKDPTKIEYVLDWQSVVKKYYNVIKNVTPEA